MVRALSILCLALSSAITAADSPSVVSWETTRDPVLGVVDEVQVQKRLVSIDGRTYQVTNRTEIRVDGKRDDLLGFAVESYARYRENYDSEGVKTIEKAKAFYHAEGQVLTKLEFRGFYDKDAGGWFR